MKCEFELKDNIWKCKNCGYTFKRNVNRECGPTLVQKSTNFTKAVTKHILNSGKYASEEEIARRFTICQNCPLFNGKICVHEKCGCNVSQEKKFLNKLSWASEQCPLDKWRI